MRLGMGRQKPQRCHAAFLARRKAPAHDGLHPPARARTGGTGSLAGRSTSRSARARSSSRPPGFIRRRGSRCAVRGIPAPDSRSAPACHSWPPGCSAPPRRRCRGTAASRGWCMTASSMSAKCPVTCGRIASSTKAPATAAHTGRCNETMKWLVQNHTSRSRNGVGVASALPSRTAAPDGISPVPATRPAGDASPGPRAAPPIRRPKSGDRPAARGPGR